MDPIRIGIADDHNLVREAIISWLARDRSFNIRLEAAGGKDLFRQLTADSGLDVLILDLNMPELNGKECLILLKETYPHIRVLILSVSLDPHMVNEMLDLGAYGYLSKGAEISELAEAIKDASMGKVHRNKILTEALYLEAGHPAQHDNLSDEAFFTATRKKILQLLWDGKSTQEIADEVFLSISAINKIKQQLKEKAGVKSTVGLIRYALENRIILPGSQISVPSP